MVTWTCRFICDNPADLEVLLENLHPQGVRESELKANIQSRCVHNAWVLLPETRPDLTPLLLLLLRYQEILHSIHLTRKSRMGLRTCDGYSELLNYLRSDINEVASRLQKGGLGYLEDDTDLEEQVTFWRPIKMERTVSISSLHLFVLLLFILLHS